MGCRRTLGLSVILCSAAAMLAGCGEAGPTLHSVTGSVTKGGKGLEGITVTMVADEGGASPISGNTRADGSFVMMSASGRLGAPEGSYKVFLTPPAGPVITSRPGEAPSGAQEMMDRYSGKSRGGRGTSAPKESASATDLVPIEYQSAAKSSLKQKVPLTEDWKIEIP